MAKLCTPLDSMDDRVRVDFLFSSLCWMEGEYFLLDNLLTFLGRLALLFLLITGMSQSPKMLRTFNEYLFLTTCW